MIGHNYFTGRFYFTIVEEVKVKHSQSVFGLTSVAQRCSVKKIFLKILQNSQEKTLTKTLAQVFSCEACKIFKNAPF